ncbi:MAG: SEC-C metal-binding domain-containing protein, partial [Candidatus Micrarchaeota archaeon]
CAAKPSFSMSRMFCIHDHVRDLKVTTSCDRMGHTLSACCGVPSVTLIADDTRTFEHTKHLLRLLNVKLDAVVMMCIGGITDLSSMEGKTPDPFQTIVSAKGALIPHLPELCNSGARVLLALRTKQLAERKEVAKALGSENDASLDVFATEESPEAFSSHFGRSLDILRTRSTPLPECDTGCFSDPRLQERFEVVDSTLVLVDARFNGLTASNVGRNDPCLCGSGRKFKKCCMGK